MCFQGLTDVAVYDNHSRQAKNLAAQCRFNRLACGKFTIFCPLHYFRAGGLEIERLTEAIAAGGRKHVAFAQSGAGGK